MRNKLEENQKVLVENEKRYHYWQEKLSKLVLQDIKYAVESDLLHLTY